MLLDQVKSFLDISLDDTSRDMKLNVYIDVCASSIKEYLNNPKFDKEYIKENFESALVLMVSKAYKAGSTNSAGGNVKMMKQGERTIEYFGQSSSFSISDNPDIKALLPAPYIGLFY